MHVGRHIIKILGAIPIVVETLFLPEHRLKSFFRQSMMMGLERKLELPFTGR